MKDKFASGLNAVFKFIEKYFGLVGVPLLLGVFGYFAGFIAGFPIGFRVAVDLFITLLENDVISSFFLK